jgi:peroxiredoxin Q/BCP
MNPLRLISLLTFAAWLAGPLVSRAANPADFTLHGANRKETFRLADAKRKFVALHFLLKTECPFCLRHTRDYIEKSKSQPGVVHVFIKPDSEADIAKWANKLGPDPVTIFRDAEAKLADAFGIPGGYKFHGQVVHYPALVLLDPSGKEVFRHVGQSNSDRLSFTAFTAKLAELKRK